MGARLSLIVSDLVGVNLSVTPEVASVLELLTTEFDRASLLKLISEIRNCDTMCAVVAAMLSCHQPLSQRKIAIDLATELCGTGEAIGPHFGSRAAYGFIIGLFHAVHQNRHAVDIDVLINILIELVTMNNAIVRCASSNLESYHDPLGTNAKMLMGRLSDAISVWSKSDVWNTSKLTLDFLCGASAKLATAGRVSTHLGKFVLSQVAVAHFIKHIDPLRQVGAIAQLSQQS